MLRQMLPKELIIIHVTVSQCPCSLVNWIWKGKNKSGVFLEFQTTFIVKITHLAQDDAGMSDSSPKAAFSGLPFVLCDKFSGFYSLVPPFFSLRLPVDTADVSRCVNLRPWSKSQLKFPAVSICIPGPSPASRSLRPAPSPSGSICIPCLLYTSPSPRD